MSAETLREAAALMRERAEVATEFGHGWRIGEHESLGLCEVWADHGAGGWNASMVATTLTRLNPDPRLEAHADAEHIASWHPVVALAVADWLEKTAAEHESDSGNPRVDDFFAAFDTAPDIAALAVARAYLRAGEADV